MASVIFSSYLLSELFYVADVKKSFLSVNWTVRNREKEQKSYPRFKCLFNMCIGDAKRAYCLYCQGTISDFKNLRQRKSILKKGKTFKRFNPTAVYG